jgi:16S rRNA (guanine966-N2)-methyltransferase
VRITGGSLRGRSIPGRPGPGVRPTASRVREALFSIVGQQLDGRSMLDAFGGSGLMAFEAWSRGAGPVTVCERDRRAAGAIRRAAKDLCVPVDLRQADAAAVLASGRWDMVVLDPPYREDPVKWLELAEPACAWRLCIELRSGQTLPTEVGAMEQLRLRSYGDSTIAVYGPRPLTGVDEDEVVAEYSRVVEGDGKSANLRLG